MVEERELMFVLEVTLRYVSRRTYTYVSGGSRDLGMTSTWMLWAPCTEIQGTKHCRYNKEGGAGTCKGEEQTHCIKTQSRMVSWSYKKRVLKRMELLWLLPEAEKAKPREVFIKFDIYFETRLLFLMCWCSFSFFKITFTSIYNPF